MNLSENQEIYQNFKDSKVVIINQSIKKVQKSEEQFMIICFKQTILFVDHSSMTFIESLFESNNNLEIYSLSNTNTIFGQNLEIYKNIMIANDIFLDEISNFNKEFMIKKIEKSQINDIWCIIQSCISGYLIKQSYVKLQKNRLKIFSNFYKDENNFSHIKTWNKDEYIELRHIDSSQLASVDLIYGIEKEELLVIKKTKSFNPEIPKLMKREYENYFFLDHPLLPKFYGTVECTKYPIIEYINDISLSDIEHICLNNEEKITIIFELILIIQYFHKKKLIYRDLKPNNVMIDQNKTAVLIDFDRMIKFSSDISNDEVYTVDFNSNYIAPEVNFGKYTDKSDIYSLGQMIYYIMNEKEPIYDDKIESKMESKIDQIYKKCTYENPELRPSIYELFYDFVINFNLHINSTLIENNPQVDYIFGCIYEKGKIVERDINKFIHYYTLSAEKNYKYAQYKLGCIFYDGIYVPKNIEKAVHYFDLAANKNYANAQFKLGLIYEENDNCFKDIDRAIYYYSLAADQNYIKAKSKLAYFYLNGQYVTQNINKAIDYYDFAAKQNHLEAQLKLGYIYYEGKYVSMDIKNAIYYFELAANQNNSRAQLKLGYIYYKGKYVSRDIKKAFYYFSLAVNQNSSVAQVIFGYIYYKGVDVQRSINKSIYYFTLAANQNHPEAQYMLGYIYYYERKYFSLDIKKVIYYFTLSANRNNSKSQCMLGYIG